MPLVNPGYQTDFTIAFMQESAYLDISSVRNFNFCLKVGKHLWRLCRNGPWRRSWTIHRAVNWLTWKIIRKGKLSLNVLAGGQLIFTWGCGKLFEMNFFMRKIFG